MAQCARNLITSTHNPTYVLPAALRHLSDTSGDNVLAYWQHFLNRSSSPANDTTAPPVTTDHISRLLQEAVRVHKKGSSGGVLPDEITDLLVRFYRHALAPEQRHMFFSLLCKEFGASQGAVDAAARAWLDLRNRPDATPENFQRAAQQLHEATQPLYMQVRAGHQPDVLICPRYMKMLHGKVHACCTCGAGPSTRPHAPAVAAC